MNIKAISTIFSKDAYINTTDNSKNPKKEDQTAAPEVSPEAGETKTTLFYNWRQETDTSAIFVPMWG
ncbi:hypothetical protein [Mucilaginibacter sp. OK098]|uniref:hypothetical protein n=1 Tax=Mucilaginibacter sp. OK098 TaxID=1855297 RepID=UPI0009136332|nr:hypothetical protein [Mucilaginibacter sp. OK098]SHN27574.1 hypothetical protein SAMN05216524_10848 [Mucilaginibacter sp. OK098]